MEKNFNDSFPHQTRTRKGSILLRISTKLMDREYLLSAERQGRNGGLAIFIRKDRQIGDRQGNDMWSPGSTDFTP